MNTHTQTVSTEELLQLIANPVRRAALGYLVENGDAAVGLEQLVVGAADHGAPSVARATHERTSRELYHVHLPKLADIGVVDFDRRHGTVRYRPDEVLEALLTFVSATLE
jgi:hypothetical protein